MIDIPIIVTIHMISVFKFWTIGGIFLHMFADSVLFDMMLKTAYEDGIDTHQDLIDRDMTLGFYIPEIIQIDVIRVIISYLAQYAVAVGLDEILR